MQIGIQFYHHQKLQGLKFVTPKVCLPPLCLCHTALRDLGMLESCPPESSWKCPPVVFLTQQALQADVCPGSLPGGRAARPLFTAQVHRFIVRGGVLLAPREWEWRRGSAPVTGKAANR